MLKFRPLPGQAGQADPAALAAVAAEHVRAECDCGCQGDPEPGPVARPGDVLTVRDGLSSGAAAYLLQRHVNPFNESLDGLAR
ncbi:MAG: hypothetical protein ACLPKI_22215 [Streptosporangiaceae bacterium]